MCNIRILALAALCIVSGCGREEVYVGVPANCTASYENGIRDVCGEIYRYNSNMHDTLRREKIC